jgi:hypothetical protein
MSGYPFDLAQLILYPLPVVWSVWRFERLKEPKDRHIWSLASVLALAALGGLSLAARSLAAEPLMMAAVLVSLISLLQKPWMTEEKGGLQLRAWNCLICVIYLMGWGQAIGID